MNNRVVMLRSNPVNPDSRVEKEVLALSKAGFDVQILAWDRCSCNCRWNGAWNIKQKLL